MNKEIYKAKTRSDDEWVYGIPFNNLMLNDDYDCAFDNYEEDLTKKFGWVDDYFYIIKPETICKCSGLKDADGTLIFNNDIVNHCAEMGLKNATVEFIDGKFSIEKYGYNLSASENFKIIGNKFDNKGGKNGK